MTHWTWELYGTKTGSFVAEIPVASGSWESKLTGQGRGTHTIALVGSGVASGTWRDRLEGNRHVLVQRWGSHIAYAGVIQRARYSRSTRMVTVDTAELRAAYMDARMLYGVFSYGPGEVALTVTSKSHSGAARAVINAAVYDDAEFWELPIDLPADGAGSYSVTWMKDERLTLEDHLSQIESDGCEIFFRPYLTGGNLRWETIVQSKVAFGTATALTFTDDATALEDVHVTKDYARQMTGILAFGKGGTDAEAYGYTPGAGAAGLSVRDTWVSFPDLEGSRLVAATEALDYLNDPVEQWSMGLSVWPNGPAFIAPGRRLDFTISGDQFMADGTYNMRVISVGGDAGTMCSVEVQGA